ncbi:hypothetical protein CAEBREN_22517 [Caenorhabditis brenneri]|uniref:Myb-like domain-containing protein n=1 Tax=Caenorhabditis brenneri TaxID=135651 RepID=G0P5L1_CAEBE|nr:hypothetical protein CAEBREN_22517 [Caenorhabditis brenneri]
MEVVPKKPGVKISSIEDNLRKEKESLMTVKAKKGNNQNVKKNKRNNPNFSEAEDLVLYSFVFRLIQKGIPKSQLKLNTARTWNKVHKYATINRDGDSMRQRWNKYLKKLDRIVQIDDFPPEMEQVLRETFGN